MYDVKDFRPCYWHKSLGACILRDGQSLEEFVDSLNNPPPEPEPPPPGPTVSDLIVEQLRVFESRLAKLETPTPTKSR